jgi:hypothetical protein
LSSTIDNYIAALVLQDASSLLALFYSRPVKPALPAPCKRSPSTTSIAPNINKRPFSNASILSAQTRVAAEALQQSPRGIQGGEETLEDEVEISESEEEEDDYGLLVSPSQILSPSLEPDTFSYI